MKILLTMVQKYDDYHNKMFGDKLIIMMIIRIPVMMITKIMIMMTMM